MKLITISSLLIFLTGAAWATLSLVRFYQFQELADTEYYFTPVYYALFAFSGVAITISFLGFAFSYEQTHAKTMFFVIGNFILLSMIAAIFLIGIMNYSKIASYRNDRFCTEKAQLVDMYKVAALSHRMLCTLDCPCYYNGSVQAAQSKGMYAVSSNSTYPQRIQDCTLFHDEVFKDIRHYRQNAAILAKLESQFQCAGFCFKSQYYLFSDTNKQDQLSTDCKISLHDYLLDNLKIIIVASGISTFLIGFAFILALAWICTTASNHAQTITKGIPIPTTTTGY